MSRKVYNLFLTSQNVFQTNSATRDLVYAVDWSFLPDNKSFLVSCRFGSSDLNITASCMGAITWDVLNSYSYTGSGQTSKQSNNLLAFIKVRGTSTNTTNNQLYVSPKNMTPVYIPARPNANLLRIRLVNANALNDLLTTFPGSSTPASPAVYILILNFEECD
jgi:hypothetical protein